MIKLRVVGTSPDHSQLILSNKPRGRRGSHTVVIDRKLLDTLQEAVYGARGEDARPNSGEILSRSQPTAVAPPKVPPRDIQRMLRAGMSVTQVAKASSMPERYVEQFYPPVLYERAGIVREARALYLEKQRLGTSGLPLGEAVERAFAQRRIRMSDEQFENAWTATRTEGQPWIVTLSFPFRGRTQRAKWRFDPRTRTLTPGNKLALDMGWVKEGSTRPTRTDEPARAKKTSRKPAAKKSAAKKKPAKKTAAKKTAKRTVARKKPATKKSAPKRSTAKRSTARAAARRSTKRAPARSRTTRKPKTSARKRTTGRKPARRR